MVLSLKRYCSAWAFRSVGIRETTLVTPLTRTDILFLSLSHGHLRSPHRHRSPQRVGAQDPVADPERAREVADALR